MAISTVITAV